MAPVSYLRTEPPGQIAHGSQHPSAPSARRWGPGRYVVVLGLAGVAALLVAGALVLLSAHASLTADPEALAQVALPLGGGTIESVRVSGSHGGSIPVQVRGGRLWPRALIPAHERVSIDLVVKRPGWVSWLAGKSEHVRLALLTPSASLRSHYLTLHAGSPIRLEFMGPVRTIAYGPPGRLRRSVLAHAETLLTLPRSAEAGTIEVAAAPRSWEIAKPALVSWFPAGSSASAVASPSPGTRIGPSTPITLTFAKPVSDALGSARPPVSPATQGTWQAVNSHTIVFRPQGYGYGLGARVSVALPSGLRIVGAQPAAGASATWTVPSGSTLRLQQILARLGYLPLQFNPAGPRVAPSASAQEAAAINPPAGRFAWRYGNVPDSLRGFWAPGSAGVVTQGALMAFQNDHGLSTDGQAGPAVWRALINAEISGRRSSAGYSYVSVSVSSQSLSLWHDGHDVLSTQVNTGIASQPTATGTYPVFEHIASGTMSGTNPDGSSYNDPGIKWISYFNGGDALHAFTRAQYGSPQSLGCVEMALAPAGQVWPYTPIGTLVHVA